MVWIKEHFYDGTLGYIYDKRGKRHFGLQGRTEIEAFAAAMNERSAPSADAVECAKRVRQIDHENGLVTLEQVHAHCGEIIQQYVDARVAELTARNAELVAAL
jgi:hypothetical protein